jgi:hypothetical protein
MDVTFLTRGHYQVRQWFSIPAKTVAVSATPHIEAASYAIPERRKRRFCPTCRIPKLQKETSNVLQTSQTLPAHPIPVARRHVGRIAGHHKRRDACDTRTTPRLRRYETNKFHCQPSFLRDARQMRPRTGETAVFLWGGDGPMVANSPLRSATNEFRQAPKSASTGPNPNASARRGVERPQNPSCPVWDAVYKVPSTGTWPVRGPKVSSAKRSNNPWLGNSNRQRRRLKTRIAFSKTPGKPQRM